MKSSTFELSIRNNNGNNRENKSFDVSFKENECVHGCIDEFSGKYYSI